MMLNNKLLSDAALQPTALCLSHLTMVGHLTSERVYSVEIPSGYSRWRCKMESQDGDSSRKFMVEMQDGD